MSPELTVRIGFRQITDTNLLDSRDAFIHAGKAFAHSMGAEWVTLTEWVRLTGQSATECNFLLESEGRQYRAGILYSPFSTRLRPKSFSWPVPAGSVFSYVDVSTSKDNEIVVCGFVEKLLSRLSLPESLPVPEFYGRNSVLDTLGKALPDKTWMLESERDPDVYYIASRGQGVYSISLSCRLPSLPTGTYIREHIGADGWGWSSYTNSYPRLTPKENVLMILDYGMEELAKWMGIPTEMGSPDGWSTKDKALAALQRLSQERER